MCTLTGRKRAVAWFQVLVASPIVGDPAVWTRTTNDSWMNDGLVTCGQPACTNLSLGGSVRSELNGSEGIADTYDDDGLGDKCGKESAQGADETYMCVWNDSTFPRLTSCYASFGVQSCRRPPGKYGSRCQRSRFSGRRQCHLYRGLRGPSQGC